MDYFEYEKEQMNKEIEEFLREKEGFEKQMERESASEQKSMISDSKYCALM